MSFSEALNIHEFMAVFGSCGNRVGIVDSVQGSSILLMKNDFADGKHHRIPMEWVDRVGTNVILNKSYREVKQRWSTHLIEAGV